MRRSARCSSGQTLWQRGNNFVEHNTQGLQPVLHFDYEFVRRRPPARAPGELRAAAHHAARGRDGRRQAPALRDHRSARRPRARHRRLQGRLAGRRGAARRASGVLRDLLSRSRARADAARRLQCRAAVRQAGAGAAPEGAEAGDHRQLPGRLGGDDAGRRAPRRHRADRHQRRADVVLERCLERRRQRQPDALRRRAAGRLVAGVAGRRPRQRQVRRRPPGAELREPESGQQPVGQVLPPVRQGRHRAAALPGVRALVGRLLPDEPRRDRVDHAQPVRRQQAVDRRHQVGQRQGLRPARHQVADRAVRLDGRQHHAAAAGLQLGGRRLRQHRGDQGARPGDRRPAARGHRSPRDLRVRQGRQEGARADRVGAQDHRDAAAGRVRHGDQRAQAGLGRAAVRGRVPRAPARRHHRAPEPPGTVRRKGIRGGGRRVGLQPACLRVVRAAAGAGDVQRGQRADAARAAPAAHAELGHLEPQSVAGVARAGRRGRPQQPPADRARIIRCARASNSARSWSVRRSTTTAPCATRPPRRVSSPMYGNLFALFNGEQGQAQAGAAPGAADARELPEVRAALASRSEGGYVEALARVALPALAQRRTAAVVAARNAPGAGVGLRRIPARRADARMAARARHAGDHRAGRARRSGGQPARVAGRTQRARAHPGAARQADVGPARARQCPDGRSSRRCSRAFAPCWEKSLHAGGQPWCGRARELGPPTHGRSHEHEASEVPAADRLLQVDAADTHRRGAPLRREFAARAPSRRPGSG